MNNFLVIVTVTLFTSTSYAAITIKQKQLNVGQMVFAPQINTQACGAASLKYSSRLINIYGEATIILTNGSANTELNGVVDLSSDTLVLRSNGKFMQMQIKDGISVAPLQGTWSGTTSTDQYGNNTISFQRNYTLGGVSCQDSVTGAFVVAPAGL